MPQLVSSERSQRQQRTVGQWLVIGGLYGFAVCLVLLGSVRIAIEVGQRLMAPVCQDQRAVTPDEQKVITAASALLCDVEAHDPAAVPDQLCSFLQRGQTRFLTQKALPSTGMSLFCRYGETNPLFQEKDALSPQVNGYTTMLRRDLLTSVAQTIPVLAHETTHAVKSPVVLLIEPQRYEYDSCVDENGVRDKVFTWGILIVKWLAGQEQRLQHWTSAGVPLTATDPPAADWPQLRMAMAGEIQKLIAQVGMFAPNAHQDCSRLQGKQTPHALQ